MENRTQDRIPISLPARLVSERVSVDCEIVDLSDNGARIRISPGLFLPKHLLLRIDGQKGDRAIEVMWRNKMQIGVRF